MAKKKAALIVHIDKNGDVIKVTDGDGKARKKKRTEKQKISAVSKIVPMQYVQLEKGDTTLRCIHMPDCTCW